MMTKQANQTPEDIQAGRTAALAFLAAYEISYDIPDDEDDRQRD